MLTELSVFLLRLLLTVSVLGAGWYLYRRSPSLLGGRSLLIILLALFSLSLGQGLQVYAYQSQAQLTQAIEYIYNFSFLLLAIYLILMLKRNLLLILSNKQSAIRKKWLKKIYESMPAGVCVEKDGEIIYCNELFQSLQAIYSKSNPFSECNKAQQDVWLTANRSERNVYWVTIIEIKKYSETVFIVNDITSVKYQQDFFKKIGTDLVEGGVVAIQSIADACSKIIPAGLIYIGKYQLDEKSYSHLAHMGDDSGINVYDPIQAGVNSKHTNEWYWSDNDKLEFKQGFIQSYECEYLGIARFSDEDGTPLGIMIAFIKNKKDINDQLLELISLSSVRVRSELQIIHNRKSNQKTQDYYKAFIAKSNDAIVDITLHPSVVTDLSAEKQFQEIMKSGKLNEINSEFIKLFEVNNECEVSQIFSIKSLKHVLNYILNSGYSNERLEVVHETRNDAIKWIGCRCMTEVEDGKLTRIWLIIQDITDSKMHIQDLEYQTRHDSLTGLPNRTALRDKLDSKLDQAEQFGVKVGLLLIDLNGFKEVNDALGHHYGDILLKKIEPRINPVLARYGAHLSRLGGDEFSVILPNMPNLDHGRKLAEEITEKVKEPFDLGALNIEIGSSIGISVFPEDGFDSSTLLRCADIAMHKAKSTPGGILNYRDDLDDNSTRRLSIMASIGKGLKSEEFYLCFQPKVNLSMNRVESCEALIRWQHPEMGMVSPGEFIPLAEMNDTIILITNWVIDQALKQIKKWLELNSQIKVSINVSTRNLLDENLIPYLSEKLREYNVPAHLLEVEITESALMADPERALETLNKISALGVSISVDDFGTGYSSLIYLRQLPLNALKVDITFVRNMCNNEQDRIIVNSIIHLAHNLSLTVVAEGAEDLATVEMLKGMACNEVQGFYFSKPLLAKDFTDFFQSWGET